MAPATRWRPAGRPRRGLPSSARLFALFALTSAVPVLLLGALLDQRHRADAAERARAEAAVQGQLLAQALVAPALAGVPAGQELDLATLADLGAAVAASRADGSLLRLRVYAPGGAVLFPPTAGPPLEVDAATADGVARIAAGGAADAAVTRLALPGQDPVRAVRLLTPVEAAAGGRVLGVLEVWLPYEVVARAVDAQAGRLRGILAVGLCALYLAVLGLCVVVTRAMRRQAEQHAHEAVHDHLTGLPNRALFHRRMADALAQGERAGRPTTVAVLDLDGFKAVNDSLGHDTGDALLRVVARRLGEAVRSDDTVSRLGGDEFGLVLPATPAAEAARVLRAVHDRVVADVTLRGTVVSVGCSIGTSTAPEQGDAPDVLLRQADDAMYRAKSTRSGVAAYDPASRSRGTEDVSLVAQLRWAVRRGELRLHYQPQVAVATGEVVGVEALLRWQHPAQGLLAPGAFLPAAERSDVMLDVTWEVVAMAAAQARRWSDAGAGVQMAVNLSALCLADAGLPARLGGLVDAAGVDTRRFTLEITETALVAEPARAAATVEGLALAGFRLSLDDFGSGYTSFASLRDLCLHELKIDGGYVREMAANPRSRAIVEAAAALGRSLAMTVVAEGVEDAAMLAALGGVSDVAQGYHFGRPVPSDVLTPRLVRAADAARPGGPVPRARVGAP